MSSSKIRRGDLYWVDWHPARGSEQSGHRPALVIQTDAGNSHPNYPNTIVAAVSTASVRVPTHVQILPTPLNGLSSLSSVKCEQLMTISKERLQRHIGTLNEMDMLLVDAALKRALALE